MNDRNLMRDFDGNENKATSRIKGGAGSGVDRNYQDSNDFSQNQMSLNNTAALGGFGSSNQMNNNQNAYYNNQGNMRGDYAAQTNNSMHSKGGKDYQ